MKKISKVLLSAVMTAAGLLSTLRFWWTCTDAEYYYSYSDRISRVTPDDLNSFVQKYIQNKNPLVTVLVNPEVYEKTKAQFDELGFTEVTADNAFWFRKQP